MNKWREMQAFISAVKNQSFSAAARQIGLSPSMVSKLISALENRLAVRLFNRTTRSLSLTEAGKVFYLRCDEIISELESVEQGMTEFGQQPCGVLKLNCSAGFAKHELLPLLPEFQQRYCDLEIELQLTGQAVDLVVEGIDLAIRMGKLSDTSLVARKLGEYKRIVCASPEYLDSHAEPLIPTDLEQHNCLRLTTSENFNHWRFKNGDQHDEIEVRGSFITDNVEMLHDYCLMGAGITRLSSFMVQTDIDEGRLVPLLNNFETDKQIIHAVYPHRKFLPAKVKVFVDFLLQKLKS